VSRLLDPEAPPHAGGIIDCAINTPEVLGCVRRRPSLGQAECNSSAPTADAAAEVSLQRLALRLFRPKLIRAVKLFGGRSFFFRRCSSPRNHHPAVNQPNTAKGCHTKPGEHVRQCWL